MITFITSLNSSSVNWSVSYAKHWLAYILCGRPSPLLPWPGHRRRYTCQGQRRLARATRTVGSPPASRLLAVSWLNGRRRESLVNSVTWLWMSDWRRVWANRSREQVRHLYGKPKIINSCVDILAVSIADTETHRKVKSRDPTWPTFVTWAIMAVFEN
jgi:hypothetical protein